MRHVRLPILLACLAAVFSASAYLAEARDLGYYLPRGTAYDDKLPRPASVLGYEVGEWHVRHDQIIEYFRMLAAASPRMSIETIGHTHEKRPLLLATITSPRNLARIDEIRERHLAALSGEEDTKKDADRPVVIWMGYSVHGNESSGGNSSLLLAYHLAAAKGKAIDRLLDDAVILIDPCLNPDGFSRFSQWANSHRGKNLVGDPLHREHREVWPGGRTNHYWFDLNRDWLLLTHPESRARLAKFHAWKPNVVTDFHEMGTNSSYFFQPGVPTRQNPNTPDRNLDLTRELAGFHAKILDRVGSLYYTEERFDDFYYGKGSTYPDVNGSVGILFEQASSRGHLQESSYGPLEFPFTIKNQFLTSLSTLEGSLEMRPTLLSYQQEFYQSVKAQSERDPLRAYVFERPKDRGRLFHFLDILSRHQIEIRELGDDVRVGAKVFKKGEAFIVPLAQPQYRLIHGLFSTPTKFRDNTFYDVSTWTLPLSFGLRFAGVDVPTFAPELVGDEVDTSVRPSGRFHRSGKAYAYVFDWNEYFAPRAAYRLLDAGVKLRATKRPFTVVTTAGPRELGYGAIVVPLGIQTVERKRMDQILGTIAKEDYVDVYAARTGLTPAGIDLGSPQVAEVSTPKPLLVVGSGVSSYEAGAAWHLLDERHGMKVSMVEASSLKSAKLERYTHCIFVSGDYRSVSKSAREELERWVERGGVIVSKRSSIRWIDEVFFPPDDDDGKAAKPKGITSTKKIPYADYERVRAERTIRGAIFEAEIDTTHPLGYGYTRATLPVFRNSTIFLDPQKNPIANVVRYSSSPLLSGFVSNANLAKIRRSAVVCANRVGRGLVVRITDDLNFRGVWYGTNKLFLNTLFFGSLVRETTSVLGEGEEEESFDHHAVDHDH